MQWAIGISRSLLLFILVATITLCITTFIPNAYADNRYYSDGSWEPDHVSDNCNPHSDWARAHKADGHWQANCPPIARKLQEIIDDKALPLSTADLNYIANQLNINPTTLANVMAEMGETEATIFLIKLYEDYNSTFDKTYPKLNNSPPYGAINAGLAWTASNVNDNCDAKSDWAKDHKTHQHWIDNCPTKVSEAEMIENLRTTARVAMRAQSEYASSQAKLDSNKKIKRLLDISAGSQGTMQAIQANSQLSALAIDELTSLQRINALNGILTSQVYLMMFQSETERESVDPYAGINNDPFADDDTECENGDEDCTDDDDGGNDNGGRCTEGIDCPGDPGYCPPGTTCPKNCIKGVNCKGDPGYCPPGKVCKNNNNNNNNNNNGTGCRRGVDCPGDPGYCPPGTTCKSRCTPGVNCPGDPGYCPPGKVCKNNGNNNNGDDDDGNNNNNNDNDNPGGNGGDNDSDNGNNGGKCTPKVNCPGDPGYCPPGTTCNARCTPGVNCPGDPGYCPPGTTCKGINDGTNGTGTGGGGGNCTPGVNCKGDPGYCPPGQTCPGINDGSNSNSGDCPASAGCPGRGDGSNLGDGAGGAGNGGGADGSGGTGAGGTNTGTDGSAGGAGTGASGAGGAAGSAGESGGKESEEEKRRKALHALILKGYDDYGLIDACYNYDYMYFCGCHYGRCAFPVIKISECKKTYYEYCTVLMEGKEKHD